MQSPKRSPLGAYVRSPLGVRGGGGGDEPIWFGRLDAMYELEPTNFGTIRSIAAVDLYGIGGKEDVIWRCRETVQKVEEVSVTDFSLVRDAGSPKSRPQGIGGNSSVIWHCNRSDPPWIYELSVTDFSVVRGAAAPGTLATDDIGGDSSKIWYTRVTAGDKYELSTVDLSVVQSTTGAGIASGIGGSVDNVWYANNVANTVSELSATDLSTIRSDTAPGTTGAGVTIGGV